MLVNMNEQHNIQNSEFPIVYSYIESSARVTGHSAPAGAAEMPRPWESLLRLLASADLFEVAFVIEELVRDVEAVWIAFGGINHHDTDRCDRHAFCASACFLDLDRSLLL